MKQRMQGMIVGMALMFIMLSPMAVSAAAKVIAKKIDVEFGGYKIQVNGEDYALKDKDGKTVEPFEYDGELYAPVSRLADAFKYLYTWDDKKGVLNILPANQTQATTQSASGDVSFNNYRTFLNGIEFQKHDALGNVLEPLAYKNNVYLPIDSVLHSLGPNGAWDSTAGIFYFGPTTVPATVKTPFLDAAPQYDVGITIVSGEGNFDKGEVTTEKSILMGGEEFSESVTFYLSKRWTLYGASEDVRSYSLHNLGGKYKQLTGEIGHVDGFSKLDAVFNIYGDGKLLQSYEVSAQALPTPVSINVQNIQQLKLEIEYETITGVQTLKWAFVGSLIE